MTNRKQSKKLASGKSKRAITDSRAMAMLNAAFSTAGIAKIYGIPLDQDTFYDLRRDWAHPVDLSCISLTNV